MISARAELCGAPHSRTDATLDGAAGHVFSWSCTDGYRVLVIATLQAGRGYQSRRSYRAVSVTRLR